MNFSVAPLSFSDQIVVSMASIPARLDGMLGVLARLLPTCDRFIVCLNGYPDIHHALLDDPKVTVVHAPSEMGPRGKFYLCDNLPGYHIIVDDDILYPRDYVPTMIQHIEKFERQAVVGAHGKRFMYRKPPSPMTFEFFNFAVEVLEYQHVHMLGTGVMAYHSDTLTISPQQFEPGKIDDQFAIYCQENMIPCVVVPHAASWLADMEDVSLRGALRKNLDLRREASARIQAHEPWKLYTPTLGHDKVTL